MRPVDISASNINAAGQVTANFIFVQGGAGPSVFNGGLSVVNGPLSVVNGPLYASAIYSLTSATSVEFPNADIVNSLQIGSNALANGVASIALGPGVNANADKSIAVGSGARALAPDSIALGTDAIAAGSWCVSLGKNAVTQGANSFAGVCDSEQRLCDRRWIRREGDWPLQRSVWMGSTGVG